ncbi:MAG: tryptophan--tRNA ligase [Acidimicrobiia bacterium]|jgi:tryptophanyl-tRNA synthetase|nr:tryptophan--tRNA ligase [Acidimicrobiia bacterium]MBP8179835.1 tryptophan--tRNA ligase [Acidimicrobiia bacterium]
MERVFSGIQPTGLIHLGNYLGALRSWVQMQDDYDAYYCVVDLHGITVPYNPTELAERTVETVAQLLAVGLDPQKATLFVQSHVPAHTEMQWLLNSVTQFGELRRMTQFKDKSQGQDAVSAGIFNYPILMAADILVHNADRVPVGDDQRQHLELARNVAQRFNQRFGEIFTVPDAAVPGVAARVKDLTNPEAKMSKSAGSMQGVVSLLDPPKTIAKKIKSAVTDSGTEIAFDPAGKPGISNLLAINAAVTDRSIDDVIAEFDGLGYGHLKVGTADATVAFLEPIQARYAELMADPSVVAAVIADGAKSASAQASEMVIRAKDAMGLLAS